MSTRMPTRLIPRFPSQPVFRSADRRSEFGAVDTLTRLLAILLLTGGFAVSASAQSASLTIDDGVVVKFSEGTGFKLRDRFTTGRNVVFTSLHDDAVAGQTSATAGLPEAGDWRGVKVEPSLLPARLLIDRLEIRYAGADSRAALEVEQHDYLFQYLKIIDGITGIRSTGSGSPIFEQISLLRNLVGLESGFESTPIIQGSEIVDNSEYGVLNQDSEAVVSALDNWWGHVTGPFHPDSNLDGEGNRVSDGVDYGQPRAVTPLIDCSVAPANGLYTVSTPVVQLRLSCRNAQWMRVSEDPTFGNGDDAYHSYDSAGNLLNLNLSTSPTGLRAVYAQFMAEPGNTVTVQTPQPINYAPGAPVVTILAPPAGATITTDTLIRAEVNGAQNLQAVSFLVNGSLIAVLNEPPYEALWQLGSLPDGPYTLRARAQSDAGHTDAQITVHLQRQGPDEDGPVISDLRLAGVELPDMATLTSGGLLTFQVTDASGIGSVQISLTGRNVPGGLNGSQYSAPLTFDVDPNGPHTLLITARDTLDNETIVQRTLNVNLPAPAAPTLNQPVHDSTITLPQLTVAGSAMPGSEVQLYLDNQTVGDLLPVAANGAFSTTVSLPTQGSYAISADARNSRGTSPRSANTQVEFAVSAPTVVILSPPEGASLSEDVEIAVQANDPLGIARVEIFIDGQSATTITEPPYSWAWAVSGELNGPRVIRAEATNSYDLVAFAQRNVVVEHPPEEPPPVLTPYTGIIDSVTPAVSYGDQNIAITGRAIVSSEDHTPVPSAQLALVLKVGNFERRINTTSNATGQFSFTFVPSVTDVGSYQVGARHPDQVDVVFGGAFTINRLTVRPNRINLRAAYTVDSQNPIETPVRIDLRASAGSGINGITLHPDNVPNGIDLDLPPAINLGPGGSTTVEVGFAAEQGIGSEGSFDLEVRSTDSGALRRGLVRIDYTLVQPMPLLRPQPLFPRAGVARNQTVTASLDLKNMGLVAATGVQVQLRDGSGGLNVPSWISLVSGTHLGDIEVGGSRNIQVVASPHQNVAEGPYPVRLRIQAANTTAGDVSATITVSEGGLGDAEFYVADIYTDPEGEWGAPVLGMHNARVRMQKEVPDPDGPVAFTALTNADGVANFTDLPAGRYRYRITGPSHVESLGYIHVQPGITVREEVFLDYDMVSFEWSVTETTIVDYYEVIVEAVYQTRVPAAVVSIRPAAINLPPMQIGEELTGTLTISNLGLIRADNVVFTPPENDEYFEYEFLGEIPTSLEAQQRITVPYRVISLSALPTPVELPIAPADLAQVTANGGNKSGTSNCGSYRQVVRLGYEYQCINGEWRGGSTTSSYGRIYGTSCGSSGASSHYGCQGCQGGNWPGGRGGPLGGSIPMFNSPGCTPDCESCDCQGGGASGGDGGGSGSGSGGGSGTGPGSGGSGA